MEWLSSWTLNELRPALSAVGGITVQALDTLPLPILVVGFLVLLALLQLPTPQSPVLPSYSPSMYEKGRLSPLPNSPPSIFPTQPRSLSFPLFHSFDNRAQYVAVINEPKSRGESGSMSPPRSGHASRRGSRQNSWRGGRLGVVDETPEERV